MTLGSRVRSGCSAKKVSLWQQGQVVRGCGATGAMGAAAGPHLQSDWVAMAATLQPEEKMVVARLKHSL